MRGSRTMAVAAVAVTVCCVVAGCGQPPSTTRTQPAQECVQAVFTVLSGMFTKPYDNGPFEAFITRYGTQSVTYNAYLDVFTSFYSISTVAGVAGAQARLRPIVMRDCAS